MEKFLETHRYLHLTTFDGRRLVISCAYVRQLEEAPNGGTLVTVADQASTRYVTESLESILALLAEGTVRYAVD